MRVNAGQAKGRRLKPVPGQGTRPITDRAKQALFNILGSDVVGSCFLDLFAGTGGVGIEALSRGAKEAVFVEKGSAALRTIHANLEHTGLAPRGQVKKADVFEYLAHAPRPFDYVYIAPPQYKGLWSGALRLLDQRPGWLYEDGWVIVQIHPREYEDLTLQNLVLFDQRTYGSVLLCFYQLADEAGAE